MTSLKARKFFVCNNDFNEKEKNHWVRKVGTNLSKYFISQILDALFYIKEGMGYVHKDLKLNNVLLSKNFTCKLCDFSLTTKVEPYSQFLLTGSGTTNYMGPEFYNRGLNRYIDYTEAYKIDYFALGISTFRLLTGEWIIHSDMSKKTSDQKYESIIEKLEEIMEELKTIKEIKKKQKVEEQKIIIDNTKVKVKKVNKSIFEENLNEENGIRNGLDEVVSDFLESMWIILIML